MLAFKRGNREVVQESKASRGTAEFRHQPPLDFLLITSISYNSLKPLESLARLIG